MMTARRVKSDYDVYVLRQNFFGFPRPLQTQWPLCHRLAEPQGSYFINKTPQCSITFFFRHYCSFPVQCFIFFFVFIGSVTVWLQVLLLISLSSYILWNLTQQCCLPLPCRVLDIAFSSDTPQQNRNITRKCSHLFPLFIKSSNLRSITILSGFKRDEITRSSFMMSSFRAPVQVGCSLDLSLSITSGIVNPYVHRLSTTSSSPSSPLSRQFHPAKTVIKFTGDQASTFFFNT